MCDHCGWHRWRENAEMLQGRIGDVMREYPEHANIEKRLATLRPLTEIHDDLLRIKTRIEKAQHASRENIEALWLAAETIEAFGAGRAPRSVEQLLKERYEGMTKAQKKLEDEHDPSTGEVPLTDRDVAAPSIAALVARLVDDLSARALDAYAETKEPASFTVTCHLDADPVIAGGVAVTVKGKLQVGIRGAAGTVSIDDKQTRLPGA